MFRLVVLVALLAGVLAPGAAAAAPGSVTLVRTAGPAGTPAEQAFLRQRIWRMHGAFNWHPATWARRSAYELDPASPEAAAHPEWILKDGWGNHLWIGSGYAADFGNPDYRAWWIGQATAQVNGYRGLYIDDVAMERRAKYAFGYSAVPRDPRTNKNMSEANWQRYMADFMVEVRAALPASEIVHDVLWHKGDSNVSLQRQLAAADLVALEQGFVDPAVVGGPRRFGWQTLAAFVETRQAAGQGVILDGHADGSDVRLYGLANSLLVDLGATVVGNDVATAPGGFWRGYNVRLGHPSTGRYAWNGVWRRDFANGLVLVNEPRAGTRTVTVGRGYADLDGDYRESVTLSGGSGAVLVRAPVPPSPPPPPPPPAAPVAEAPPATAAVAADPPMPKTTKQRPTRITTRGAGRLGPRPTRTSAALSPLRVYGRVGGARNGSVRVTIQRKRGRRWATIRRTTASVSGRGSYTRDIPRLTRGSYRVSARFLGTGTARPSASGYKRRSL